MKKRILVVSPTGTLDNGAEKSIVNLMIYLAGKGYHVFNAYPDNQHETKERYIQVLEEHQIKTISIPTAKWWWPEAPGTVPFLKTEQILAYQQAIFIIRQIIREENIQLVISNTANVFQGSIAAACEAVPHFWLFHEFPTKEFAYYREKIEFMVQNSAAIFAVHGNLHERLKELFPASTDIQSFIPYSDIEGTPLQESTSRRLVSIGRINENKNQLELIKAYHQLNQPQYPLVFIGDWDEAYKAQCDDYIAEHKVTNVHFLGHQNQPWGLVSKSDICVLNSQSEAFPLVFVEAVLNGVPVIASDNLGYQSVKSFLQAGTLYHLGDVKQLVQYLKEHLERFEVHKEESLRQQKIARGIYCIDTCYQQILKAIEGNPTSPAKGLHAIRYLLGEVDYRHLQSLVDEQFITVYFEKGGTFSETHTTVYPLELQGTIDILLPEDCQKIRIDMTERPSFYTHIQLLALDYDTSLLPIFTNGLVYRDSYIFPNPDPQLIFQVPSFYGKRVRLRYSLYEIDEVMSDAYIGKQLAQELLNLRSRLKLLEAKEVDYQQERIKVEKMQRQLEEITAQYNQTIASRRWTISTALINFFRRKK
ncbi:MULTISPECIES: glycosyltransferase [unclassified Streptococcus]|uniref:glycosyltransferase n=1 Tax=unclassified Streptococcus TaxID=2608887 RepID=UPI0010727AB9|nr:MULTISPECIES: glycosyltransferase [unclassified Streptococcus]MBF0786590.1 glycosyltransferase [Streptococcus sp. 19428wC2_LYSM12]MCQ9210917.1 glycosyltransferase [Streptococcus sp. B01]MCQ9214186.1 glycosyltransferase [Streptococcus sp. O1]TFV06553.1 glycosyltransferase [Streptococcus sp. LYSM12]